MKILYAIQGTGNGHMSRAREILPVLRKYGQVDVLVSGTHAEVHLGYAVKFQLNGLGFAFGKKGGIDLWASFSEASIIRLIGDIERVPVQNYDLVINDFEPVTAWACMFRKVPCIALSHQASMLIDNVPMPRENDVLGKVILRNYAPAHDAVGFHFQAYAQGIFTPVIRMAIANAQPSDKDYYTVYLPAYDDIYIASLLSSVGNARWHIFSKKGLSAQFNSQIFIEPIGNERFVESLVSSTGILTGGGFETPAEALYLGKKLLVVPMIGQYEQQCNAAALKQMGVPVVRMLNLASLPVVSDWVMNSESIMVNWSPVVEKSIELVFDKFEQLYREAPTQSWLPTHIRRLIGGSLKSKTY